MISLPWPAKELSPNARVHWSVRAKAAKAYREQAYYLARNAHLPHVAFDGPIGFQVKFCPPDKRHRDDDNLISAFKAARDGIADALGVNDRRFAASYLFDPTPIKGGAVIVTVEGV